MIERGVIEFIDDFNRQETFAVSPNVGHNGWCSKITKTGGSPTLLCVNADGGQAAGTLAATSEVEVVTLYQGDVLPYAATSLQQLDILLAVTGVDANTTVAFGLSTAENDTPTSMTNFVLFLINGGTSTSNIVISGKDGTNTYSNIATGTTLGSTFKKFVVDFQNGIADVRFFIDGARVAAGQTFNFGAFTSSSLLQPIVQIGKSTGTGVGAFKLDRVRIQSRYQIGV